VRSNSASICLMQCQSLQRFGLMVLALLLANGVVLLDMRHAVCATEEESTSEESQSSTEESEPSAEETEPAAKEAEPAAKETKSDEPESEPEEPPEKKASSKKPSQKSEEAEPDSDKESDKEAETSDEKASDEEKKKQEVENEKAKAEEAAGVEVEVVDDSEEEEPEETIEEEPPVVEETEKETPKVDKRVIGATATIMEKKSELLFRARVDSGAKSCSLHIEDMKIENESDNMADNIGKVVRFNIKNGNKESHWLEAKIAGYVIIKTSNASDDRKRRYKVPLTFRYKDFEKTVLVTLNNRQHMEFPLLLGRNFLKGDFVVDVEVENND